MPSFALAVRELIERAADARDLTPRPIPDLLRQIVWSRSSRLILGSARVKHFETPGIRIY
jgi:hypothetical protein